MKLMRLYVFFCLLIAQVESAQSDYSDHPKAQVVIATLVAEHGFSTAEVKRLLALANTEQKILDSMANAAEKTKTWSEYRASFVKPLRVSQGKKFLKLHAELFARAEREFGVPREMIAAILGVETNYGSNTGRANVLSALATLAFEHPRRSEFFTAELIDFFVLSREQNWQAENRQGSYAGAMGYSQFMPSNYRRLAVDYNADGLVDLFNVADAIGSIANYFVHHGWIAGDPVAVRAYPSAEFDEAVIDKGLKPNRTVLDLTDAGYKFTTAASAQTPARIVKFQQAEEYWLCFNNFYALSRYNPRAKYAMAVYQLSLELAED